MIYKNQPKNFNSKFDIVSCFVEYDWKILLLHRQDHKPEGNTWWVPAWKVDLWEGNLETVVREIQEETGIVLDSSELFYFEKLYIKFHDYDFIYYIYHTEIDRKQEIIINNQEHKDFVWITPKEALKMPLIQDEDECIKLFYNLI